MDGEGVLHIKLFKKAKINLETAQKDFQQIDNLLLKQRAPILVDIRNSTEISDEAIKFFSKGIKIDFIIALAVLEQNPIREKIMNFFMEELIHYEFPIRVFTKEEHAHFWLVDYTKQFFLLS